MIARFAAAALAALTLTGTSLAQGGEERPRITVFDQAGYQGRSLVIDGDAPDLRWVQFNDRISSIRVEGASGSCAWSRSIAEPARSLMTACPT